MPAFQARYCNALPSTTGLTRRDPAAKCAARAGIRSCCCRRRLRPTSNSTHRRFDAREPSSNSPSTRVTAVSAAPPKFPHPGSIERCLRHWLPRPRADLMPCAWRASRSRAWPRAASTINSVAASRATRSMSAWMIPHFEKMLYDNGQLLGAYATAALATGESLFARIAGRDRGLGAARHARCRGRLLLEPRCGFRGPRGQVLPLESIRGARAVGRLRI